MNKIVKTSLLARDKFMPVLHLKQPVILTVLVDRLLNIVKGFKNIKKQVI